MLNKLLILSLTLMLLTPAVSAVRLSDIDTDPEEIELYDTFKVDVSFSGDTCGTTVEFFMDGILFSSKIVGCDRDSIESTEWDLSEDPVDCGRHTLRVDLTKAGECISNISQEIKIGNHPLITIPDRPIINEEFIIHLRDSETGKPLNNLRVEIYNTREGIKNKEDYYTNSNGNIEFKSKDAGEFKLTIDDPEYCGSKNFYVKKIMNIDGPYPAAPLVGELIKIAVPRGVGVLILNESGDVYIACSTSIGGGVNFTMNYPGKYTLVIGELHTIYWGRNISLYVSEKPTPSLLITPEKAVNNRELTIEVKVEGEPLEYAEVFIQNPSGGIKEYETDADGVLMFTPSSIGKFQVKTEKIGYKTSDSVFEVKNSFDVIFTPPEPEVDEDLTLFVRDQLTNLVQGATVSIWDTPYGTSGLDGRLTLKSPGPGKHTLKITKQGFWDFAREFMVLSPLSLKLDYEEIELGESVTVTVVDVIGDKVQADVEVTNPDGGRESIGESYKPWVVGVYEITASKEGYTRVNKTLIVNPCPIDLDLELTGDRLLMKVTSHQKPVLGISLIVEKPNGTDILFTDSEGKAETGVKGEGLFRISVNVANPNTDYGKVIAGRNIVKRHDLTLLIPALFIIALAAFIVYTLSGREGGEHAIKKDKKYVCKKPTLSSL